MNQDYSRDVTDQFTVVPNPDFAPEVNVTSGFPYGDIAAYFVMGFLVSYIALQIFGGGRRGK